MPTPPKFRTSRIERGVAAKAYHQGVQGTQNASRARTGISTDAPHCPVCEHEMRLMRDVEETLRGRPCTWWCPEDASVMRAIGHSRFRRMMLTVDGDIVPYQQADLQRPYFWKGSAASDS